MATKQASKDQEQATQDAPEQTAPTVDDVKKALAAGRPLPPGVVIDFADPEPIKIADR